MRKTVGGCALSLALVGACAPAELEQEPPSAGVVAGAYVAAPTCGPTAVGSLQTLLPDGALLGVMEVDLQALQRSPLFRDHKGLLEAEAKEFLDGMKACGVPLSKVERVVAGLSGGDDVVLGVRAKGLARPKTLDCLARTIEKSTGKPAWSRTTTGCTTTLDLDGGDAKGFAVGPDMLVVASKGLADSVQRRIDGKDKSILDGQLGWARREVDMSGTAWVASNLPPGTVTGLSGSMSGLSHVGMSLDASRGLGLNVSAGFATTREASAAKTELDGFVGQARAMMPLVGLSPRVADTITVGRSGAVVHMDVFLDKSDVAALRKSLEGAGGGASSPPPRKGM